METVRDSAGNDILTSTWGSVGVLKPSRKWNGDASLGFYLKNEGQYKVMLMAISYA